MALKQLLLGTVQSPLHEDLLNNGYCIIRGSGKINNPQLSII